MRSQRNEDYHRIITSYKWQMKRLRYLGGHPLCEICEQEGRTKLAEEVHHVIPIESASSYDGMLKLAFDTDNLQALCHECHAALHESSRQAGTKATTKANAQARVEAFVREWLGQG